MIDIIFVLKFVHVLGAAILFGTSLGSAFFMIMAHRSAHAGVIALTARFAVTANLAFTVPSAVLQPITGLALTSAIGLSPSEPWIVLSNLLYLFAALCWLPLAFVQRRIRDAAHEAAVSGQPLPDRHRNLFRLWLWLAWPAFAALVVIFALMTWQPRFE